MVWLLGLTQIIGYGTLYYGFAILVPDISAEFGWPVAWVYGALSLALLAGGIVAPFAGNRIDRHDAAKVIAFGSVGGAAARDCGARPICEHVRLRPCRDRAGLDPSRKGMGTYGGNELVGIAEMGPGAARILLKTVL